MKSNLTASLEAECDRITRAQKDWEPGSASEEGYQRLLEKWADTYIKLTESRRKDWELEHK